MSKTYIGLVGKNCMIDKIYIGEPNKQIARMVKKAYIGDQNNKARLVFLFVSWTYSSPTLQSTHSGQTGSIYGYSNFEFDDQTGYFTLLGPKSEYSLDSLYSSGRYIYISAYHATGLHYMTLQKVSDKTTDSSYTYDVWTMKKSFGTDDTRYEENDTVIGYTSITKGGSASGPTFGLSGRFDTEFFEQFGDTGGKYYIKDPSEPGYYEYTVTYNPSTWSYTQSYVYYYPVQSTETFASRQSTGWNASSDMYRANETVVSTETYTVETYKISAIEN